MSDNENHKSSDRTGPTPHRKDAGAASDCLAQEMETASLISRAREVVYRTPEVRPEKVARFKEAIEQGTYKIDSRQLADILIKEWFPKR